MYLLIKGFQPISEKTMEFEYHHFATSQGVNGFRHQQLIISQKENQQDIICLLMKEHSTTYHLPKEIKPKFSDASETSC